MKENLMTSLYKVGGGVKGNLEGWCSLGMGVQVQESFLGVFKGQGGSSGDLVGTGSGEASPLHAQELVLQW